MSTNSQATVDILVEIYEREAATLLRYVIEVSKAPVVSGRDPDALSKLQDVYRDSGLALKSLESLMGESVRLVDHVHWPLQFTSFNFLRPIYLLEPVADSYSRHLDLVEGLHGRLVGLGADSRRASDAASLIRTLVDSGRAHVESLRAMAREVAENDSKPAELKGTSASRW